MYLLDPKPSEGAKLQLKKATTLSFYLHVLFIYSILVKLNLEIYLILNQVLYQYHSAIKRVSQDTQKQSQCYRQS